MLLTAELFPDWDNWQGNCAHVHHKTGVSCSQKSGGTTVETTVVMEGYQVRGIHEDASHRLLLSHKSGIGRKAGKQTVKRYPNTEVICWWRRVSDE